MTEFNPYQPTIWVTPNPERASVSIQGVLVPIGTYSVKRSANGGSSWTTIRGGTGTIATGQFAAEDSEPPLGVDLLYKVTIDQTDADIIERNSVTTPRVIRGIGSWVVAAPRTGTVVTDTDPAVNGEKVLKVSSDAAGASVWTVVRTNLVPNPQDRTGGAAGWTTTRGFGSGGAGTYTHSQAVVGPVASPTTWTCCRKTWTSPPSSAATAGFQIQKDATNWFGVTAGQTVTVSGYMRHSATTQKTMVPRLQFYDRVAVSGAVAVGALTVGTAVPAVGSGWVRVTQTITVPTGALGLQVFMDTANVGDTPWVAGNTLDCTGLLVEVAPDATAYYDGSSVDVADTAQYDWAGTAWNSSSTASALHMAGRQKIATVGLGGTLTAGRYHISGRIKYHDTNMMRWLELRDGPPVRTWTDVLPMGSWGAVRGTASSDPDVPYGEVRISVVNSGGTTVSGPVVAISPSVDRNQQWIEFNLEMTLTGSLTGGRVVVSHGNNTREYTATWWLTRFIVLPQIQAQEPYLHFFDGDWPAPSDAEDYAWKNGVFDSTQNGSIAWEGTAGNSTSILRAPDVVYAIVPTRIDPPVAMSGCDPVHLNLPIQPTMGQWFGLIKVGTLSHPGRAAVMEIIRRRPAIVVSDVRGWERGELTLLTRTLEERRMAVAIFATGQVIQFRNPNPLYPEGSEGGAWYLGVTDVNEERPLNDHRRPERYWSVSFVRVEKPVGLIDATYDTGSPWQHVKDTPTGATWQVVRDTYVNWADVMYRDASPTDPNAAFAGSGVGLPTQQANDAWQQEVLPTP